jgi:hypothetical protein
MDTYRFTTGTSDRDTMRRHEIRLLMKALLLR